MYKTVGIAPRAGASNRRGPRTQSTRLLVHGREARGHRHFGDYGPPQHRAQVTADLVPLRAADEPVVHRDNQAPLRASHDGVKAWTFKPRLALWLLQRDDLGDLFPPFGVGELVVHRQPDPSARWLQQLGDKGVDPSFVLVV